MAQTNVSALHDLLSVLGAHPSLKKVDLSYNSFGGPEVGAVFANHTSNATWCVQRTTFNVQRSIITFNVQRSMYNVQRTNTYICHVSNMYVVY